MAADNVSGSGIAGSVQTYIDKEFMNLPRRTFDTPLMNASFAVKAKIPKNNGTHMECRKHVDYEPEAVSATDDAPKLYSEAAGDPSAGFDESAATIQCPLLAQKGFVSLGDIYSDTDPSEVVKNAKTKLRTVVRRVGHRVANQNMVNGVTDPNSFIDGTAAPGFKTVYAQGASNFGQLTEEATFQLHDFKRVATMLANAGVPPAFGGHDDGLYGAVVNAAIWAQLMEDDKFLAAVNRGYKTDRVLGKIQFIDLYRMRFICQHDTYRANLESAGGALATRRNNGKVHVAHVVGKKSFAYLDLGQVTARKKASFKVQDITPTGTNMTIGYNIPFNSFVLDADYGVNIAGTTNYDETLADIA